MTQSDDYPIQRLANDLARILPTSETAALDAARELSTLGWTLSNGIAHQHHMRARAMEVVGRFSHVQELIVETLVDWGRDRINAIDVDAPKLDKLLNTLGDRPNDDTRINLVKLFAEALDSDALLNKFKSVYKRAKKVRDALGHGAVQYFDDNGALVVQKLHGNPTTLTRDQLEIAILDCQWLDAQIMYIAITGTERTIHMNHPDGSTGPQLNLIRPTETPEDWNGTLYQG